jgi:Flp pilus assembly protein TadG
MHMSNPVHRTRLHDDERGAAMVILAISVVVLFAFAALAVDLGAAWAQRRTSQGAVDAAAMAGALEYLTDSAPTSATVVDVVRDYASRNVPIPVDSSDWLTCTDPEGVADGFTAMTDSDGNAIQCISLKQGATGDDETLLRVRLPNVPVNTAFASVIGFDTIDVSAVAIAEIRVDEQSAILPLSLPQDFGAEECLGTPPSGQLHNRDTGVCTGPTSGNFGLLNSPFFEEHSLNGLPAFNSCGGNPYPNFSTRAPFHLALGIDHAIQPWPTSEGAIPLGDLNPIPTGGDTCAADTAPPEIPYVLFTETGFNFPELHAGLVGSDTFDGSASRLRQTGGAGDGADERLSFVINGSSYSLDNIGLWEYLIEPNTQGNANNANPKCEPTHYGGSGAIGRTATEDIVDCLEAGRLAANWNPEFSEDIIYSPRFALVPILSYSSGQFTGSEARAIVGLVPVYLHTTWYDCGNGLTPYCAFMPDDFEPGDPLNLTPADHSILFNPGEGSESPVVFANNGSYGNPRTWQVEGISALVLDWDWLFDDAKNELGEVAPLSVHLFR